VVAPRQPVSAVDEYERGAERLRAALVASDDPRLDFATRVHTALATALSEFAADPGLARLLTVVPYLDRPELVGHYRRWRDRFAATLRRAASSLPRHNEHPDFLEAALLGGLRWQIAIVVLAGRESELPELEPQLSRYLLSYYLPPSSIEDRGLSSR
jgi:hypothetical protein